MIWRQELAKLESSRKWSLAVELMQDVLAREPDNLDAYLAMIYLLKKLLVDEQDWDHSNRYLYEALLKKYFHEAKIRFYNNAEFLFFSAMIGRIAEWYMDLEEKTLRIMLQQALIIEPSNLLYQYGAHVYGASLVNNQHLRLTQKILDSQSHFIPYLKSKGSLGESIVQTIKNTLQSLELRLYWQANVEIFLRNKQFNNAKKVIMNAFNHYIDRPKAIIWLYFCFSQQIEYYNWNFIAKIYYFSQFRSWLKFGLQEYSQNAIFLFLTAILAQQNSWLFGLSALYIDNILRNASNLEPENQLYLWWLKRNSYQDIGIELQHRHKLNLSIDSVIKDFPQVEDLLQKALDIDQKVEQAIKDLLPVYVPALLNVSIKKQDNIKALRMILRHIFEQKISNESFKFTMKIDATVLGISGICRHGVPNLTMLKITKYTIIDQILLWLNFK